MRTLSDTEMQMNCVERMAHYAQIPREKSVDKDGTYSTAFQAVSSHIVVLTSLTLTVKTMFKFR